MRADGPLDWLEPTKPITPETITAATESKLFFRVRLAACEGAFPCLDLLAQFRFKPEKLASLSDSKAALLIHQQVASVSRKSNCHPTLTPALPGRVGPATWRAAPRRR